MWRQPPRCCFSLGGREVECERASGRNRGKRSSPEITRFFPSFDCVRHFELERLLPFTLLQLIRGNITGDSEHKHAPATPARHTGTRVHKAQGRRPTSWIRRQTASTWGTRPRHQGPSHASSPAPAPAPWATRDKHPSSSGLQSHWGARRHLLGRGGRGPPAPLSTTSVTSWLVGGRGPQTAPSALVGPDRQQRGDQRPEK